MSINPVDANPADIHAPSGIFTSVNDVFNQPEFARSITILGWDNDETQQGGNIYLQNASRYRTAISFSSGATANKTITIPNDTGTLTLTKNVVTSFNGITGAVTFSSYVTSFNGLTGAVTGLTQGAQGIQGVTGATGAQGIQGVTGTTGTQGVQGVTGSTGAQGNTGPVGDYVVSFNGSTGAITFSNYVASVNGVTGAIVSVGLTSGKLSQFASTTSAELAGVVSDETGSGSGSVLVFNSSPSITTAINTASASFNLLTTNATSLFIGSAATTGRIFGYTGTLAATQSVTVAGANTGSAVNKTVNIGTGSGLNGTVTINVGQSPTEGTGIINLLSNTAVSGTLNASGNISAPNIVNSFNGLTGDVTGITAGGANTFTALNTFSAGISAAGGVTFSGTFSGTTGAFSKLLTASAGISASGATFSGSIGLQNAEYIRNTTDGRIDFMPAPSSSTAYGMYFDMTSWTYGVAMGTIKSSDGVLNNGNFRFDAPLTISNDVNFNLGSNGQNFIACTQVGLDTTHFSVNTSTGTNSGAFAIVSHNASGFANRSPTTSHANPNLYVYRTGSANANDFIRVEHDGTNGNIISGGTSGILIQPGSGVLGISGGISLSAGITFTNGTYQTSKTPDFLLFSMGII